MKKEPTIELPTRLDAASTLGIFSPSEPLVGNRLEMYGSGIKILESKGYSIVEAKHVFARDAFDAGTIEERIADINQLLLDPEVDALMNSWGGKGCNQLLPHLNFELIAHAKKPILGFSDGCVLLNAISAQTGLVSFYGPNVVGKLHETEHSDLQILHLEDATSVNLLGDNQSTESTVINDGEASGRLFGGNLSTFTLGCLHLNELKRALNGAILCLEEGYIPVQIVLQHLHTLKNHGVFDVVSGVVIGCFETRDTTEWKQTDGVGCLQRFFRDWDIPVVHVPTFGHVPVENQILPIGARCSLNVENFSLKAEHSLTAKSL